MTDQPEIIRSIIEPIDSLRVSDTLVLTYEERFFRRKIVTTTKGTALKIELEHARRFQDGEFLQSENNLIFEIKAAKENLLEVRGDLTRLAWHIGNRHQTCQIEAERLLVQSEPVMAKMLMGLGAEILEINETFNPERGAYVEGHSHHHDH